MLQDPQVRSRVVVLRVAHHLLQFSLAEEGEKPLEDCQAIGIGGKLHFEGDWDSSAELVGDHVQMICRSAREFCRL